MLEPILQGLREVEGVQGAMIVDPGAAVIAHRAHAIYDLAMLQQVARSVVVSVESVQLIQDDWELLTAHFGDGRLLLRSLRVAGVRPRRYILAVIADATLNVAFLGVALRVAAGKLLAALEVAPAGIATGRVPAGVDVADGESSAYLTACTKALAASVGPMAKVFVKEAVRRVCGDRPFTRDDGPALLADLAEAIEDADDRATFQRMTRTL